MKNIFGDSVHHGDSCRSKSASDYVRLLRNLSAGAEFPGLSINSIKEPPQGACSVVRTGERSMYPRRDHTELISVVCYDLGMGWSSILVLSVPAF
jgi:hypothetical protein